jgi:hypothetical protein
MEKYAAMGSETEGPSLKDYTPVPFEVSYDKTFSTAGVKHVSDPSAKIPLLRENG